MVPGTSNEPSDGLRRHIYEISKRLGRKGLTIVNVASSVDGSFNVQTVDGAYTLVRMPVVDLQLIQTLLHKTNKYLGMIPYYFNYKDIAKRFLRGFDRPVILHTHGLHAISQPGNESKACRRLVTFHGFRQLDAVALGESRIKATFLNAALKNIYRNADHYTAFSGAMKSMAARLYGIERNRITIVPHGVDAKFFSSRASPEEIEKVENRFKLDKPHRVLFLGHLTMGRGLDILLKAFKIIRSKRCDIILVLRIGLNFETLRLINTLGVKDIIRFIGNPVYGNDLRALYQASNMFVNLHSMSAPSTAVLESLASGVPPIVYKFGVNREIVDRSTGVILETLDPVELANAIENLVDDKMLAERLGRNAMDRAMKEYDWDNVVVPSYIRVYNSLIG